MGNCQAPGKLLDHADRDAGRVAHILETTQNCSSQKFLIHAIPSPKICFIVVPVALLRGAQSPFIQAGDLFRLRLPYLERDVWVFLKEPVHGYFEDPLDRLLRIEAQSLRSRQGAFGALFGVFGGP